jgi:hypothetical protein
METHYVRGSIFFGRQEALTLLNKRLEAFLKGYRQNVGIIGPEFIGKTSLVRTFLSEVERSENILPVFFTFRELESFERFSERWMGELLLAFFKKRNGTTPSSFTALIQSLRPEIPKTIRQMREVKKLILRRRPDQAFRGLLNLSGVLEEETKQKMFFVLDEFHRLGDMGLSDPFADLGREIMLQKETLYLATSSKANVSRSIFHNKLALLFGNFEVIQLEPLKFEEAHEFILSRCQNRPVSNDLARFIIRTTDGHPYYMNLLVNDFALNVGDADYAQQEIILREILARALFDENGRIYQHFISRIYRATHGRNWALAGDVLAAIAVRKKKILDISRLTHWKINEIQKVIERLVAAEIVEKHGSSYLIRDTLFRYWLANVYFARRFLFDSDFSVAREAFCAELESHFQAGKKESRDGLPKKIEELLRKFHNDTIEMVNRKFKCPKFSGADQQGERRRCAEVCRRFKSHQTTQPEKVDGRPSRH